MMARSKLPRSAEEWLACVEDGTLTMSQRSLASIEKLGGMEAVKRSARKKGVHLLLLTDDTGKQLVAASKYPFQVIC